MPFRLPRFWYKAKSRANGGSQRQRTQTARRLSRRRPASRRRAFTMLPTRC
ncbi:hypothetical protein KCP75_11115 [Salmonella enterica subsp. enterica]|nr:hypothetical protein KCP75_11115 [Salmonella enterica subsp. enterica]